MKHLLIILFFLSSLAASSQVSVYNSPTPFRTTQDSQRVLISERYMGRTYQRSLRIDSILATVNGNVGTFTNATVTVNAKGLVTSVATGSAGTTQTTSYQTATATSNQTAFTFTSVPTTLSDYQIHVNGDYINQNFYTVSSNTITFTTGLDAGDVVTYHRIK